MSLDQTVVPFQPAKFNAIPTLSLYRPLLVSPLILCCDFQHPYCSKNARIVCSTSVREAHIYCIYIFEIFT